MVSVLCQGRVLGLQHFDANVLMIDANVLMIPVNFEGKRHGLGCSLPRRVSCVFHKTECWRSCASNADGNMGHQTDGTFLVQKPTALSPVRFSAQ